MLIRDLSGEVTTVVRKGKTKVLVNGDEIGSIVPFLADDDTVIISGISVDRKNRKVVYHRNGVLTGFDNDWIAAGRPMPPPACEPEPEDDVADDSDDDGCFGSCEDCEKRLYEGDDDAKYCNNGSTTYCGDCFDNHFCGGEDDPPEGVKGGGKGCRSDDSDDDDDDDDDAELDLEGRVRGGDEDVKAWIGQHVHVGSEPSDLGGVSLYGLPDRYVIQGDVFVELLKLPANSVDVLYTNPPFAITGASWDKPLLWEQIWPQIWRVLKDDGVVVLHCSMPFTTDLIASQRSAYRYSYVWEKNNSTGIYIFSFF